jgi:hypothetical protein
MDGRNYRAFIKKGKFNTFFIQKDWPIENILREHPEFELVYQDKTALIYRLNDSK